MNKGIVVLVVLIILVAGFFIGKNMYKNSLIDKVIALHPDNDVGREGFKKMSIDHLKNLINNPNIK